MDTTDIEYLEAVAEIHEQTDSTAERVRVLCQLAESLDSDELQSLESDAEQAFNYPSLSGMDRATARVVLDRIGAVEDFRAALEDIHESRD
jgi:hypothetical protein